MMFVIFTVPGEVICDCLDNGESADIELVSDPTVACLPRLPKNLIKLRKLFFGKLEGKILYL